MLLEKETQDAVITDYVTKSARWVKSLAAQTQHFLICRTCHCDADGHKIPYFLKILSKLKKKEGGENFIRQL